MGLRVTRLVLPVAALLGAALSSAEVRGEDPAPPAPPHPTRQAVDEAIEKGVAWVLEDQNPDGTWGSKSDSLGHTALAVFALLHAGLREDGPAGSDRRLARALKSLDHVGPGREDARDRDPGTYATSLLLLLLRDRGREEDRPRLQRLADLLSRTQAKNGQWGYQGEPGDAGAAGPDVGDNSNTQFAVLALGAGLGEGVKVPKRTLEKAETWWRSCAQTDGGFGYSSGGSKSSQMSGSMTAAGIASLAVLDAARAGPSKDVADLVKGDVDLRAAVTRLASGFSVERNEGPAQGQAGQRQKNAGRGWLHYYLWAVERAMVLAEEERIAGRDWYGDGAAHLLATQYRDGSWRGEQPFYATCFALLFLTRAADPPRAFTPRDPSGANVTPGAAPPSPVGGVPVRPEGTVEEWLRDGLPPDDLRAGCLADGAASLRILARALDDADPKVRQRAFEALSSLLPPDRVEGADRHPLARGRLVLWIRRNLPFLRAEGPRFVLS